MIDIRELNAITLMTSGNPGDLALASYKTGRSWFPWLSTPLSALRPNGATRTAGQSGRTPLAVRCHSNARARWARAGGRDLETSGPLLVGRGRVKPFVRPFSAFVRHFFREAQAKMLRRQLKAKFRSFPKWANERLDAASSDQIERWSTKILRAETLEGVLGKK